MYAEKERIYLDFYVHIISKACCDIFALSSCVSVSD